MPINYYYISIPLTSAFIGWVTTYLALKMIFRPHRPVNILGIIKFQGLVPKRQKELAINLGETIEENLISHQDIEKVLKSPEVDAELKKLVEEQIEQFLEKQLKSIPMIGMFLQGELLVQVKSLLIAQFQNSAPELIEKLLDKLQKNLSFKEIIREKVESFEIARLEEIVYRIASRELKAIELICGVFGFLIGLVQIFFI